MDPEGQKYRQQKMNKTATVSFQELISGCVTQMLEKSQGLKADSNLLERKTHQILHVSVRMYLLGPEVILKTLI